MRKTVLLPALGVALLAGTSLARAQTVDTFVTPVPVPMVVADPIVVAEPVARYRNGTSANNADGSDRTFDDTSSATNCARSGAYDLATRDRDYDPNDGTGTYLSCASCSAGRGGRPADVHRGDGRRLQRLIRGRFMITCRRASDLPPRSSNSRWFRLITTSINRTASW